MPVSAPCGFFSLCPCVSQAATGKISSASDKNSPSGGYLTDCIQRSLSFTSGTMAATGSASSKQFSREEKRRKTPLRMCGHGWRSSWPPAIAPTLKSWRGRLSGCGHQDEWLGLPEEPGGLHAAQAAGGDQPWRCQHSLLIEHEQWTWPCIADK